MHWCARRAAPRQPLVGSLRPSLRRVFKTRGQPPEPIQTSLAETPERPILDSRKERFRGPFSPNSYITDARAGWQETCCSPFRRRCLDSFDRPLSVSPLFSHPCSDQENPLDLHTLDQSYKFEKTPFLRLVTGQVKTRHVGFHTVARISVVCTIRRPGCPQ